VQLEIEGVLLPLGRRLCVSFLAWLALGSSVLLFLFYRLLWLFYGAIRATLLASEFEFHLPRHSVANSLNVIFELQLGLLLLADEALDIQGLLVRLGNAFLELLLELAPVLDPRLYRLRPLPLLALDVPDLARR